MRFLPDQPANLHHPVLCADCGQWYEYDGEVRSLCEFCRKKRPRPSPSSRPGLLERLAWRVVNFFL